MDRMTTRRSLCAALAALSLVALTAAGCGSSSGQDYGGRHPDYATALAGSPAPLAALHKQADQLLDGGVDAYEARIAALEGYPVVSNVWASWCGPCRYEFPTLQKLSARYGKRVAFVGVNSKDGDDSASTFLGEAPLSYPSYTDPDGEIAAAMGTVGGLPDTAFYNRAGELCFLKQGPYVHQEELEADVRRYALRGECESG
jgi:thiol-disulfide isomerase/thioredoxin